LSSRVTPARPKPFASFPLFPPKDFRRHRDEHHTHQCQHGHIANMIRPGVAVPDRDRLATPFRPISPKTSPDSTLNETSSTARNKADHPHIDPVAVRRFLARSPPRRPQVLPRGSASVRAGRNGAEHLSRLRWLQLLLTENRVRTVSTLA
jgi:hypothetical protein